MQPKNVTVVAIIVDKEKVHLYKKEGDVISIKQGDLRVRKIIEESMPILIEKGEVEIDISSPDDVNHYAEFEKKSNGFVRFFRVAKEKVAKLFGAEEPKDEAPVRPATEEQILAAVNEIMEHATPVTSEHFHEEGLDNQTNIVTDSDGKTSGKHAEETSKETIIAVAGDKIIPGMEKIKNQFARAAHMGSTVGVENFLKRLGAVIHQRRHSVDDLLKFLERADLPIADDGSIVIYKVLARFDGDKLVDCHTRSIVQWPGAYVCMSPDMVDHNRRNECSNGLHVARRGYIGNFNGDVVTICKLAPEDVIAVPEYDANKMRVCGYHILGILPQDLFRLLKQNKPISDDPNGARLLTQVLRGEHIGVTHRIEITSNETKATNVTAFQAVEPVAVELEPVPEEIAPTVALADEVRETDEPIDPTVVNQTFVRLSRREEAYALNAAYHKDPSQANYDALLALKRTAKVGWAKLGIEEPKTPEQMLARQKKVARPARNYAEPVQKSHKETIASMLPVTTKEQAEAILKIKRTCKKSWVALGISTGDLEDIMRLSQDK